MPGLPTGLAIVAGAGAIGLIALVAPLSASTTFTTPTENPFVVPVNASGQPKPFTVKVGGFEPNTSVYIEQCDGNAPASADWTPTKHCDVLSSPAAAITDAHGVATFDSSDPNHAFTAFKGVSPQHLFNCLGTGEVSTPNGLPNFDACQIRVASTNTATTPDQVFLTISLPKPGSSLPDHGAGPSDLPYRLVSGSVVVAGVGAASFLIRRRGRGASA
jgi:hypothetical protein